MEAPDRLRDNKDRVQLRCCRHDLAIEYLRQTVSTKLRRDPGSLCPDCRAERPKQIRHRSEGGATWHNFVTRLGSVGWDVPDQEWKGSSLSRGGVQRYEIIHRRCGTSKRVGIHQALQKLNKSGQYGCATCAGIERRAAFAAEAERWGLRLPAETPATVICTRPDCPRGTRYAVSPDNLHRKGPPRKACRQS